MPEKLLVIRQHLNVSQVAMQQMLNLPKAGRVSQYENGVREPSLMVKLCYGYFGKVSLASIVDDDVSIKEFRKQLGEPEFLMELERSGRDRWHVWQCARQQEIEAGGPDTQRSNGRGRQDLPGPQKLCALFLQPLVAQWSQDL
jgi:hypothetical protein